MLIPAHNEGVNLIPTLKSAGSQLSAGDRILVVADNCTDDTASIARSHGVEVVERSDPNCRGKGYALAFGRKALRNDPPDVVVVLDADCTLGPDALLRLSTEAVATQRPAQAAYRMVAPEQAGPDRQVAAFAFLVKNVIRPSGLRRFGQSCLLTGTGMAFPWAVYRDANLAHGHIVEDLGLTVDLALAGHPPVFVPEADVRGEFPNDDAAASTQRRRWEHGHLSVIRAGVPRLIMAAIRRRSAGLVALALEVGLPPLSALVMVTFTMLILLLVWAAFGGPVGPALTLLAAFGLATIALFAVWWCFGRSILPTRTLARIPRYAVGKVGLYADFFIRPQRTWNRTPRQEHKPSETG